VVGRERFELSTYGLRVRVTAALMASKVKNLQRFFTARRVLSPKPNLCRTPFRWRRDFLGATRTGSSSCVKFRPTRPRTMQPGVRPAVSGSAANRGGSAGRGVSRGPGDAPRFTQRSASGGRGGRPSRAETAPPGTTPCRRCAGPNRSPNCRAGVGDRAPRWPTAIDDGALHVIANMSREFDWADTQDQ
jgi:hypothetical protein